MNPPPGEGSATRTAAAVQGSGASIDQPPAECLAIAERIHEGRQFLIVPHVGLDGDDMGSMLGLAHALDRLGKSTYLYSPDQVPRVYQFLPGWERLTSSPPEGRFDAVLLLECPSSSRLPKGLEPASFSEVVVNLDHHQDNHMEASHHWVDASYAAVGEMAVFLLDALGVPLDREIALPLYLAVLTDTGSFQFSNVTPRTHRVAARLVEQIGDVSPISRAVYRQYPAEELQLVGKVLATLERSPDGKIAWAELDRSMLDALGLREEDTQNLVESINRIQGVEVLALFKHLDPGTLRVSLRSAGPPVNQVAARFGGGGHRLAAGLQIETDDPEGARHRVLEALRAVVEDG